MLKALQKQFMDLGYGSFIHFNSATAQFYNHPAIEDWEFQMENGGAERQYPFREQDWNPTGLDCAAWAKALKAAGCGFAAFTSKHHEGFCAWPTRFSEHCVRNAANTTDVVAEYLKAFRAEGIAAGLYFSILDLTAGINRHSCTPEQKALIRGEITELLTNYGPIPFLMVDGWNSPWGGPSFEMLPFAEVNGWVKALQPQCLLLNIGWNKGPEGSELPFFEGGAGQMPDESFRGPGILCQKLTSTWFWRETHPEETLASAQWARDLAKACREKKISFMLNLSPNVRGGVDENLRLRLAEVGREN